MFENSQFKPTPPFNEEINQQLNDYENWKQQKNNQQTTCQVEQQPEYFIDDLHEIYEQWVPEIINKTQELEKKVEQLYKNKSYMTKGNDVYNLIECLKDQEESIKQFSQQISFDLRKQLEQRFVYSNKINKYFFPLDKLQNTFELNYNRDFRKMQSIIQKYLYLDFKLLREKTNKYILDCQKVYVCQKPVPQYIPTAIENKFSAMSKKSKKILKKIEQQK